MKRQTKKTVYVAMSGGVDSSVAAALLKKQGFNVVGVYMKPWQPNQGPWSKDQGSSFCLWKEDREDALRAASTLDIPLYTWDFSREYKKEVADYMIKEYKTGRTANPDVMCNKEIKFGLFLKRALREGADYIATGHYIRIKKITDYLPRRQAGELRIKNPESNSKFAIRNSQFSLLKAKDTNKDQSYFLWALDKDYLKYCLFPVGDYLKPEVRKLAKKFKLPNASKKDSQGVCFIGQLDMKEFLKNYIKSKPGKVLDTRGMYIGEHEGVYYYTIGQRHGLDIKNGQGPYYVTGKNIVKNIVIVGKDEELFGETLKIKNINWLAKPKLPATLDVRLRYRAKLIKGNLGKNKDLRLLKPERAITPGQSAVFYLGQKLVGGGVIV